jgi:hypothetical protein
MNEVYPKKMKKATALVVVAENRDETEILH